jgi:transposase
VAPIQATLAGSMPSALNMSARPAYYPPWFAQRCIYLWDVEGETKTAIAKEMRCDRRTVARFVARWQAGEPLQTPGQTGSIRGCRVMDAAMTADMLELVRRRNDLFLPEIAQELYQLHGVTPSVWQVCRALRANGITRKNQHALTISCTTPFVQKAYDTAQQTNQL